MEKLIQVIILILIIFFSRIFYKIKISKLKYLKFFCLILVLFCFFQELGVDLNNYRNYFKNFKIIPWDNFFEFFSFSGLIDPFFVIVFNFLKKTNFHFNYFKLISGAFSSYFLYKIFIEKIEISKKGIYYFLLLNCLSYITILRHFPAMVMLLYGYLKRKKRQGFILALFSVYLHKANLIGVFLFPFLTRKYNKQSLIALFLILTKILCICIVALFMLKNLQIENAFFEKIQYYLFNKKDREFMNGIHIFLYYIPIYIKIFFNSFLVYIFFKKVSQEELQENNIYYNNLLMGFVLLILFVIINKLELAERISSIFLVINFIVIDRFVQKKYLKKTTQILLEILLVTNFFLKLMYISRIYDSNGLALKLIG